MNKTTKQTNKKPRCPPYFFLELKIYFSIWKQIQLQSTVFLDPHWCAEAGREGCGVGCCQALVRATEKGPGYASGQEAWRLWKLRGECILIWMCMRKQDQSWGKTDWFSNIHLGWLLNKPFRRLLRPALCYPLLGCILKPWHWEITPTVASD